MAGTMIGEGGMAAPQAYKLVREIEADAYNQQKQKQEAEKITMQQMMDLANLPLRMESEQAQLAQKIHHPGKFSFGETERLLQNRDERLIETLKNMDSDEERYNYMRFHHEGLKGNPPPEPLPDKSSLKLEIKDPEGRSPASEDSGKITITDMSSGEVSQTDDGSIRSYPEESDEPEEERKFGMEDLAAPFVGAYEGIKSVGEGIGNWLMPDPEPTELMKHLSMQRHAEPSYSFDEYRRRHPDRMTDSELELRKRRLDLLVDASKYGLGAFSKAWKTINEHKMDAAKGYSEGTREAGKRASTASRGTPMTVEEKAGLARYKQAFKDVNLTSLHLPGHARVYIRGLKGVMAGLGTLTPSLKKAIHAESRGYVNLLKSPYKEQAMEILQMTPPKKETPAPKKAGEPKASGGMEKPKGKGFRQQVEEARETNQMLRDLIKSKAQGK